MGGDDDPTAGRMEFLKTPETKPPPSLAPTAPARRSGLSARVAEELRRAILSGVVPIGGKLPSEAALTASHGVSRTVVREAIAQLRADGLVEPRQGAGVFVTAIAAGPPKPFQSVDPMRLSSAIELLELRSAVEIEAAGLAALRRSPAQDEAIFEHCAVIERLIRDGAPTVEADFALHLTIADATNNMRFREFLEMLGEKAIPRRAVQRSESGEETPSDYLRQIQAEHRAIADAISRQEDEAAREAMRIHLKGGQMRYRKLLRKALDPTYQTSC